MELQSLLLLIGAGLCLLHWLRKQTPYQREQRGLAPINRIALTQSTAFEHPKTTSDKERAVRLVSDIALHNDIVLFTCSELEQDATALSRLIHDVLEAVCDNVKVVDVGRDSSMSLGLEQSDGKPILPSVYVGGQFVGGQNAVLEALDNGELIAHLERAKIGFDRETAQAFMKRRS